MPGHSSAAPKQVTIAWLMADHWPGYHPLFFGQFSLLQDFALHWKDIHWGAARVPVEQFTIGSQVTGTYAIRSTDPTRDEKAYLDGVQRLCLQGEPLFAIANFIHKDSAALARLCELKKQYNNFHLIVVLHCTRDEFIGQHRFGDSYPTSQRAERRAQRLANFLDSLPRLGGEGGADAFVAVSQATLASYTPEIQAQVLSPDRMWVIPNGVDARHYRILPERRRAQLRAAIGLGSGWTAGISSRWTQAKGKCILERLLDHMEVDPRWTFLAPALAHDQLFDFLERLPERWPRLLASRRVRLYLDLSRFQRLAGGGIPEHAQAIQQSMLADQPEAVRQVFEHIYIGQLDHPIYHLLDLYLRPSVAEAFGLSPVEAYLCGVPVLASDRDGLAETVLPVHQVHLPEGIRLTSDDSHGQSAANESEIARVAGDFYTRMCAWQSWAPTRQVLRQRMLDLGLTIPHMLRGYERLLRSLHTQDRKKPTGTAQRTSARIANDLPLLRPKRAMVEITRRCNLHCPLCPVGNGQAIPLPDMSEETFRAVLSAYGDTLQSLTLHNYGEPTLHPQLADFIKLAKQAGIPWVDLSTNGMFITRRLAARLVESGLDAIRFSVDTCDPQAYAFYRVGGQLAEVLRNMAMLRLLREEAGSAIPLIEAQALLMRENEDAVAEFKDVMLANGADRVRYKTLNIFMSGEQMAEQGLKRLPQNPSFHRYASQKPQPAERREYILSCHWPWDRVVILGDGQVVPCCHDYNAEYPLGQAQAAAWDTLARRDFILRQSQQPESIPMCRRCAEAVAEIGLRKEADFTR